MSSTKVDYRRELPELYRARREAALVHVPELLFLMVDGHGDPNTSADFRDAIEVLYSVAYTIKFTFKQAPDGFDFAVMPLEALWWADDMSDFLRGAKSNWSWTAMIMQPDQVSDEHVSQALEAASRKRELRAAAKLRLERFHEGRAAQILHLGPYSTEGPTIATLHKFIGEQGLAPAGKHHEIYLGDPRRAAPEKLRTIIRQPVARRAA